MTDATDNDLRQAAADFVHAFQVVFRSDWEYTKGEIESIKDGATFIDPGVDDESEDWAARGALLRSYRKLVALLRERDAT